jgi:hypothetical protein
MATLLPRDSNDIPIPALRFRAGGAHKITAGAVSARNSVAFASSTRVVGVYASVPVFINFGGSDVTATSAHHYLPEGLYYDLSIGGGNGHAHFTHIAVLAAAGDGDVYISEKE